MDQPVTATGISFDNSYARLPERFFARVNPEPVGQPELVRLNRPLARELGLDPDLLATAEWIEALAGNRIPEGADPIAQAYAGHQFGNFVPQLGDGRAVLLGEIVDPAGQRRDIQLKGSGRTPFSRMGDGRAPLGPVLREYIISEAMAAMGVPTTRSLAAVATGEAVIREATLQGAVLTRIASSHIRVGTFQFFAVRDDTDGVRVLADYAIARHDPEAANADNPYLAFLERVIRRQAVLVAKWMGIGFIHGVMNTDNMTISGETIDYGPCAFMDAFHPGQVYSSIDRGGRYAFANQARIAQWNLAQFAQCLLPLLAGETAAAIEIAQAAIDRFPDLWLEEWLEIMRAKLGLASAEDGDAELIEDLLARMAENEADFTLAFRLLADAVEAGEKADIGADAADGPQGLFQNSAAFDEWAISWRQRLQSEGTTPEAARARILATNPLYIPRNHLVEEALAAASAGDFQPFETLLDVLAAPFDKQDGRERYATPPTPEEIVQQTFCGT